MLNWGRCATTMLPDCAALRSNEARGEDLLQFKHHVQHPPVVAARSPTCPLPRERVMSLTWTVQNVEAKPRWKLPKVAERLRTFIRVICWLLDREILGVLFSFPHYVYPILCLPTTKVVHSPAVLTYDSLGVKIG